QGREGQQGRLAAPAPWLRRGGDSPPAGSKHSRNSLRSGGRPPPPTAQPKHYFFFFFLVAFFFICLSPPFHLRLSIGAVNRTGLAHQSAARPAPPPLACQV